MKGANELKNQARLLRERLARAGVEITHSLSLEAISAVHGHKDWNTAVASSNVEPEAKSGGAIEHVDPIYVLECDFAEETDDGKQAEFRYVVRAKDADQAVELMKNYVELSMDEKMIKLDIRRVFVDHYYRIDVHDRTGAIIDLTYYDGNQKMRVPLPFGEQPEIMYGAFDYDVFGKPHEPGWDSQLVMKFDAYGNRTDFFENPYEPGESDEEEEGSDE